MLGLMYHEAGENKENIERARYWLEKAAEQGHAKALHTLALIYKKGVPKTYVTKYIDLRFITRGFTKKYIQLLKQSAELGYSIAQYELSVRYEKGEGVKQDNEQAIFWMEKAAYQGLSWAYSELGERYAEGRGVERDPIQAYAWLKLDSETESSRELVDELAESMLSDELVKAKKLYESLSQKIEQNKKLASESKDSSNNLEGSCGGAFGATT